MKSVLQRPWFIVDHPWGDGSYIVAGHPDPHRGTFVTDCEDCADIRDTDDDARAIAEHICKCHNEALARAAEVPGITLGQCCKGGTLRRADCPTCPDWTPAILNRTDAQP